ncbi:NTP transferase domain-containing protein [Luteolibacter yonseiensis]|uniref:Probable molybdenum cofactor guanylyltransferase n=2 Tax=Luteolibacter yonseiensis TaxID=1144680 RepID=A0A934R5H2_9BACT|nr:NTP transferase domain-containing protein [Luteolibacter yonseiensis]MBK1817556.1 NTP transferase domain-containing protein [Luteolibacter yonseiensis]
MKSYHSGCTLIGLPSNGRSSMLPWKTTMTSTLNSDNKPCGLVLAGGRSTRMGVDKAELVHPDGRTLAARCRDLLREAGCDRVVISLRHEQEIPAGLDGEEIVRDPEGSDGGPMAGILSGMRLSPSDDWLVVACDLPRLDVATLVNLVARKTPEEKFLAYRSEFDGLPEPLCALYSHTALPILEQAEADGFRHPRKILMHHGCRLLEPATPRALDNANTPEDWVNATAPDGGAVPEWRAGLHDIWISPGNDFRGRHERGRLEHGIQRLSVVECVAGMGLRGDRYFGYKPDFKGQVTFLSAEVVDAVRKHLSQPDLCSSVFRRNLIVSGVELGEWKDRRFSFQGVEFQGSEECKPCYWMDRVAGPGAEVFLSDHFRGGLRARILTDGILRCSE